MIAAIGGKLGGVWSDTRLGLPERGRGEVFNAVL
jgi:hypothetical protein